MFLDIENIGTDTLILILGAIEQEIWAKLWLFWRHIGNQYGGHQGSRIFLVIFFMIFRYHRTRVQRVMLSSKTERFWRSAAQLLIVSLSPWTCQRPYTNG